MSGVTEVYQQLFAVPTLRLRRQPKTAVILTNYNMPERTDALCSYICQNIDPSLYELIVVDNGSDLVPPSDYTTVFLPKNRQTCGGWLAGLDYARSLREDFLAYWIMITSAEFVGGGDILAPMVEFLLQTPEAAIIHPALTKDSTTAWVHMKARSGQGVRRTWMVDNIAALYRASWFDSIGWFDPRLTYAWGTDLESCYIARKQKRSIWIDERVLIKKITNIGYTMNRMRQSAAEREKYARQQMQEVLGRRYGPSWRVLMRTSEVRDEWR